MGKDTAIQWCDSSWNPWYGCHKVSPGCAYCYMDRWAKRRGSDFDTVTRAKDATFYAPLKWKEPKRIFTCSLSDFFIEEADGWRGEAFAIIDETPHTYLILTKRIDRLLDPYVLPWIEHGKFWPNVYLGVSVENQRQADERIPKLLQIPAAKRFVSIEPLLGPIDFNHIEHAESGAALDWVIVGGESGGPEYRRLVEAHRYTNATHWRPKSTAYKWVRSLRDQCQAAGIPYFFKQWGGSRPDSAGSLIDGREWKEI